MRVALYARVSSDRQELAETIQSQLQALRRLADQLDATIVPDGPHHDIFTDDGLTGANLDRPALTRLRALLTTGNVDAIAVYDMDRLSRDQADLFTLAKEIRAANAALWIARTGQRFEDSDEGRVLFTVFSLTAELERRRIGERARRGAKERARREGRKNGGIPSFGFDLQDGRYVLNATEVEYCRRMREWLLAGVTPGRIAQRLMALDVPTKYDTLGITRKGSHRRPATWYPDQVRRVLTHGLYAGRFEHHAWDGEAIEISVPAIFTEPELAEHRRIIERNRSLRRRKDEDVNLLRSLIHCGVCGRRYIASRTGPKNGNQRLYRCGVWHHPKHLRNCTNPSWMAAKLEAAVWNAIVSAITEPAEAIAAIRARGQDPDHPALRADQLRLRLAQLGAEDDRIRSAFRSGLVYTADQAAAELAKSDRARAILLSELAEVESRIQQRQHIADLEALASRFRDRLPHATPEQKAEVLRELIDRITVTDDQIEIEIALPAQGPRPNEEIRQAIPGHDGVILGPLLGAGAAVLVGGDGEVSDVFPARQRPQLRVAG